MGPNDDALQPWIEAAHAAADAAGRTVRQFHQSTFDVDQKPDASLVTTADVATERAVRAVLAERTPEADIHGEELEATGRSSDWRWIVDPIDGTIAFACAKPLFTTLIALLHQGRPVLGIIDQAITGDRWLGTPSGTLLGTRPVRVRPPVPLAQARVGSTAPRHLPPELLAPLHAHTGVISWGGDAYNYGALATGGLDLVLEQGLAPHDYAALIQVVRGAGGVFTDWQGRPIESADGHQDVIAASCPELLQSALDLVSAARAGT